MIRIEMNRPMMEHGAAHLDPISPHSGGDIIDRDVSRLTMISNCDIQNSCVKRFLRRIVMPIPLVPCIFF
jgi:hypothetical protein